MFNDDILNVCNFQQHFLFADCNNHRNNTGTKISTVTWWTVHKHIVTDMFCSKKSSSNLLVHEQQASQKWCLSSHHSTACDEEKDI